MSYKVIIPPHGATNVLNARKGTAGEFAIDSTAKEFVYYDGNTTGGIRMARKDLVEDLTEQVAALTEAVKTLTNDMSTYFNGKAPVYYTLPEEEES